MRIEWIKHKLVDKSKFLTKKNIWWEFEVVLLTWYLSWPQKYYANQGWDRIEQNKSDFSYLSRKSVKGWIVSCFMCTKHLQYLSLKKSKIQELRYA